jgi:pimeloyl-ACP methyl ester carboxylesterase
MRKMSSLLAGLALLAAALEAQPPARAVARQLKPCAIEGLKDEALCGTLPVWENRATRQGRKIDLSVVVLPAQTPNPAPDPVFYITGGPGYGSTGAAVGFAGFLANVRKQRDLVFVDQRGTGKSHPLHCDLPGGETDLQGYMRTLFPQESLKACEPRLAAQADLTQYTTAIAMDDLDDVRAWLGYDRINVFGGSYGTRAAQAYMRQHPDHVRSAVLTGVMIMDSRMPLYHARKAQESIDKLLDDCLADEACRAAFPDVRADLAKVIARLDQGPVRQTIQHPKTGKPVELTIGKGAFTTTLRSMQYSAALSARIPLYLHLAAQGDYRPMILMTVIDRANGTPYGLDTSCVKEMKRPPFLIKDEPLPAGGD